jgi:proteinaceous RNase P
MSSATGLEVYYPPAFSAQTQEGKDRAWWAFPLDDGTWTCAVREAA